MIAPVPGHCILIASVVSFISSSRGWVNSKYFGNFVFYGDTSFMESTSLSDSIAVQTLQLGIGMMTLLVVNASTR